MVSSPKALTLLTFYALFDISYAWFRLPCSTPLVRERLDPIVAPGMIPSNHVHAVHGGSNFGPSSTYNDLRASSCTSCRVAEDKSNYWFPQLYFQDPVNGTFEMVGNGGLLIYYQNRGAGDVAYGGTGLKAFPPGFRMVSGSPESRRKKYTPGAGTQAELAERSVKYLCLRYHAEPDYEGYGFPTTNCASGFQARVHFQSCWDGKNLDSPDHKSHVAYLSNLEGGKCPTTHPIYLMKLFYEITWNVDKFKNRWNPATQKWPFVYAHGDPTGFGGHGDFQNGWDTAVLQKAIDTCNNPKDDTYNGIIEACKVFTLVPKAQRDVCRIDAVVKEEVRGQMGKLPGCNPVQRGPGDATFYSDKNCPA